MQQLKTLARIPRPLGRGGCHFAPMVHFGLYVTSPKRMCKTFFINNDGELAIFNNSDWTKLYEELEKKYRVLKQKSLLENIKLIIPNLNTQTNVTFHNEEKLNQEDIDKLNKWAHEHDFKTEEDQ